MKCKINLTSQVEEADRGSDSKIHTKHIWLRVKREREKYKHHEQVTESANTLTVISIYHYL